jgi:hypothetical protein
VFCLIGRRPEPRRSLIPINLRKGCPTLIARLATRVGGENLNSKIPDAAGVARTPLPAKFETNETNRTRPEILL